MALDQGEILLRQRRHMQVDIAANLSAARLVPGEMHPAQLPAPRRKPVQYGGRMWLTVASAEVCG